MKNIIKVLNQEYSDYLKDESRSIGYADFIAFPKTEAEVIRVLAEVDAKNSFVTLQGARTGLAASAVPYGGYVLNLSRMNKITAMRYDRQQNLFYLTVQPGVILSQLKKAIENKSFDTAQWDDASLSAWKIFQHSGLQNFPPDPTETSATIGGMVSCNASGARTFLFGPTRNFVNALRVVLADGRTVALARGQYFTEGRNFTLTAEDGSNIVGSVPDYTMVKVKNASGYFAADNMDLVDLFIGADGTLGVVSAIEISLLPAPSLVWGVSTFFDNEATALSFVRALRGENVAGVPFFPYQPAAIEFFNHGALDILREQRLNNPGFAQIQEIKPQYHTAIYSEFHSDKEDDLKAMLNALGVVINSVGGNEADTWVANNPRDMEKLIFFRHAVPESVNMFIDQRRKENPEITKLGSDMAVPDDKLEEVMDLYNTSLLAQGLNYASWGHIGNNHVHVNILPGNVDEYKLGKALFLQWAEEISAMGGTVSAEHGVGKLKADFLLKMFGTDGIEQMRAVKSIFDPHCRLNPGSMFKVVENKNIF